MGFFGDCVRWCAELARGPLEAEPVARLKLAAAIFATLELLASEMFATEVEAAFTGTFARRRLDEVREALLGCVSASPAEQLRVLAPCLACLDATFCRLAIEESIETQDIELVGPTDPNLAHRALRGFVRCALTPHSQLRKERRLRALANPGLGPPPRDHFPADTLVNLGLYWHRHPHDVLWVEDRRRRVARATRWTLGCNERDAGRGLRVALSWLPCDDVPFHTCFELTGDGLGFTTSRDRPIHQEDALVRRIEQVLDAALKADVGLVLMPELAISEGAREAVVRWLKARNKEASTHPFFKVLAGSFHVWPVATGTPRNQAPMIQRDGRVVFSRLKSGVFKLPQQAVLNAFNNGIFRGQLPQRLAPWVTEHIDQGRVLHRWHLPFAQLSVLICADMLDRKPGSAMDALKRARPDLVLCPSNSTDTGQFLQIAEEIFQDGIGVLMVNDARTCQSGEFLALACLPLLQVPGAAPVRVGWRKGDREPIMWSFERENGQQKGWIPATHASVRPLGDDLGLVLDLSAHIREHLRPSLRP